MPNKPSSVEIRMYQVGFGDCFLLSFVYGDRDKRHVLIDFGSSELPPVGRAKRSEKASVYMPKVAADIARVCGPGGRLTALVATHRHSDHISGFATDASSGHSGSIIRKLRPRVVIQPWTEDPKARRDATHATRDSSRSRKSFVAGLAAMHAVASHVVDLARKNPAWMSAALRKQLLFLGMDNIHNESAVRNLIEMGKAPGATARWLHYGADAGLDRLLPGVKVTVLGPPDLTQSEKIRSMRKRDPDQFWHLLSGGAMATAGNPLAEGVANGRGRHPVKLPAEARWFRDSLERVQGAELLEIVRSLDDQMNNTSLILLFEVCGKRLLFPGDAQIENWSYALEDAPDASRTRKLLADVDVYKVGHHGSLNATPRMLLWEGFSKREGRHLCTLLSTLPGKHGSTRNDTEVPRKTLLRALAAQSDLRSTTKLPFGRQPELCHVLPVKP